ncbi:hypothetical protein CLTEP_27060 [Clostridium tepidiprofundi DSM 19306]|uniref:Uncharacterized protein n=1 Tax=Clostridium tepidiprofundi DSM 19306 TaxID=1121338 RepID=A0A151AQ45_9CLOT|nr:hypothetical protein [Clostridium tepidiprofundi]KYH29713.1 hypothetical protein CLTEP_27060 [Clostridium tepidiprofundi DSM 19306]
MQVNRKNIIIKWTFMAFLILMFLAFVIPIPINRVYDAIEIKIDDPSYIVQCQVKIQGRYHWNLFFDDMFDGQIVISDYKLTNEKLSKVYLSDDGWPLEYTYLSEEDVNGRPNRYTFFLGRLYSRSWFRKMAIIVFSKNSLNKDGDGKISGNWGDWNEDDGYCIVPLATSREEAIDILLKIGIISGNP